MRTPTIDLQLRTANPVGPRRLAALDLGAAEVELGDELAARCRLTAEPEAVHSSRRPASQWQRRSQLVLAATVAVAAILASQLLAGPSAPSAPTSAYGADMVSFAQSTPLLLLNARGWHVENVEQEESGEGRMEFVKGEAPVSSEAGFVSADGVAGNLPPPSERQRLVFLSWHPLSPGAAGTSATEYSGGPSAQLPVLATVADVDTRAEDYTNQGGPGDREMLAVWREDGYEMRLRAAVPDLNGFKERLAALQRVGTETWLDAMPPTMVEPADHWLAVQEMLRGIPLPPDFDPNRIKTPETVISRYLVGVTVAGAVSCEWFRLWGEARRSGDTAGVKRAEEAMATAGSWPVLREMESKGEYTRGVVEHAEAMPSAQWWGRPLLQATGEGLGCPGMGFPLGAQGAAG